jgi:hypothetical protein
MGRGILRGAAMAAILGLATTAPAAPPRVGTTVQLPTFNYFTVVTTVEVPDSGGGSLGGIGSADSGRIDRGIPGLGFRPFTNTDSGLARSGGNASVQAEIQDLEAMDRALLGDNANPTAGKAPRNSSPLAADSAGSQSIAAMRRQQAEESSAAQAQSQQEAKRLFDQASELQAAGKPGVAKVYYRMAARRATGSLRDRAVAALRELSQPASTSSADR